ncbi:MAG: pyridoxal phosphate-dependent aminotransferase [Lachnospiraceae bacterium]
MKQIHGGDIYTNQNMLDFSANINPQGLPEGVKRAVIECVNHIAEYPDISCRKLTEKLAAAEQIPPSYILCGNGAAELLFLLTHSVRPKEAVLPAPAFAEYEEALKAVACNITYYETSRQLKFCLKDDFLDLLTEDTDMVFLCNPNNPTGNLIERKLLDEIILTCQRKKILLVLDECFLEFAVDGAQRSRKEMLTENPCLLILKAFTKLYAMPGLRLGYILCRNQELLDQMAKQGQPWRVSIPAQLAGIAALSETEYVKESIARIHTERSWLTDQMIALGLNVYPAVANFIFFEGPKNLYESCRKKGILIRDCSNYRGLCNGDYRIAVRYREENKRLIEVIRQVLKEREQQDGKINHDTRDHVKCRQELADSRAVSNF